MSTGLSVPTVGTFFANSLVQYALKRRELNQSNLGNIASISAGLAAAQAASQIVSKFVSNYFNRELQEHIYPGARFVSTAGAAFLSMKYLSLSTKEATILSLASITSFSYLKGEKTVKDYIKTAAITAALSAVVTYLFQRPTLSVEGLASLVPMVTRATAIAMTTICLTGITKSPIVFVVSGLGLTALSMNMLPQAGRIESIANPLLVTTASMFILIASEED